MPTSRILYRWQGMSLNGDLHNGITQAPNRECLRQMLVQKGLIPRKILRHYSLFKRSRIKPDNIYDFTRQLTNMLQTGVDLNTAFTLLKKHMKHSMQSLLESIHHQLKMGEALHQILQQYPHYFSPLYCQLIKLGEQTGRLDNALQDIIKHLEKSSRLKRQLKQALTYPMIVLLSAICVTSLLLVFVVPQFQSMFASLGTTLPLMTRVTIQLCNLLKHYSWILFLAIALITISIKLLCLYSNFYRQKLESLAFKLPIIGKLIHQTCLARLLNTLATTSQAGLTLMQGLLSAQNSTRILIFQSAIEQLQLALRLGRPLSQAMSENTLFPQRLTTLITIAEQSGHLEQTFIKTADLYQHEIDHTLSIIQQLLEPITILFLGTIIGGLIIALYLPIFQMGNII